MTIITKVLGDKKADKLEEPLVGGDVESEAVRNDVEVGVPSAHLVFHTQARRVNSTTTLCAFVTALLFVTVGIIGGVYLYRQMTTVQTHHYIGSCIIPVRNDDDYDTMYEAKRIGLSNSAEQNLLVSGNEKLTFLKEDVEADLEFGRFERIEVPHFNNGRRGRFIHDFSANKTGIIDLDGNRCFVMPLNRSQVLPPRSFIDVLIKLKNGYYDVDTEMIRETMKVIYPAIQDYKAVGYYIARECATFPTYMLETVGYNQGYLVKRSITSNKDLVFNSFSGKNIVHLHIIDENAN